MIEAFDVQRVLEWLHTPGRKRANVAFTAGNERQAAYLVEEERIRCDQPIKVMRMALAAARRSVLAGDSAEVIGIVDTVLADMEKWEGRTPIATERVDTASV